MDNLVRYRWQLNDHVTRWELKNGKFIDRENAVTLRVHREEKYEVYVPGTSKGGIAGLQGTSPTLAGALELAATHS